MERLSVVVPVYNVEAYVERCVRSLMDQDCPGLEIILVDDGSTDHSLSVCRSLAEQDPRIQVLHQENSGLASARNAGLKAASGDYVGFVDSDDWVAPGTCRKMAELAGCHHPDVIRFGYQKVADDQVKGRYHLCYDPGLFSGDALQQLRLDTISNPFVLDYGRTRILSACTGIYRRGLLTEHRISFLSEREILNEDYLFVLQAIWAAGSVYVCSDELYYYDTRSNSLTTTYRKNMYERKKALFEQYCSVLPEGQPEVESRLRNFYIDCIYACAVNEITSDKPRPAAIREIQRLLADERLQESLKLNRPLANTAKTRSICFLMRHRMAPLIYAGYRLLKKD